MVGVRKQSLSKGLVGEDRREELQRTLYRRADHVGRSTVTCDSDNHIHDEMIDDGAVKKCEARWKRERQAQGNMQLQSSESEKVLKLKK